MDKLLVITLAIIVACASAYPSVQSHGDKKYGFVRVVRSADPDPHHDHYHGYGGGYGGYDGGNGGHDHYRAAFATANANGGHTGGYYG